MAVTPRFGTPVSGNSTGGTTATATIPAATWLAGDVIVALADTNNNAADTNTITSPTLSWTRRVNTFSGSNGYVGIYTAVAASDQVGSEVVTLTDDDGSGGGRQLTVYVLSGADSTQTFTNTNSSTTASATFSISLTGANDSWYGITAHSNASSTCTPNGNTTEDADNALGGSSGNFQGHNASAGTSQSLGGTFSAGTSSLAAIIEVAPTPSVTGDEIDSAVASDSLVVDKYYPPVTWFQGNAFQNNAFAYLGGGAGGGLGLSAAESDSAIASDAEAFFKNPVFGPISTDSAQASDQLGLALVKNVLESDSAVASDSLDVAILKRVSESDTAIASDQLDLALAKNVLQTDNAVASDSEAAQKYIPSLVLSGENAQASDQFGLALVKNVAQSDNAIASDNFDLTLAAAGAITVDQIDSAVASDSEDAQKYIPSLVQTDTAIASDSEAAQKYIPALSQTDTALASDSEAAQKYIPALLQTDNAVASDSIDFAIASAGAVVGSFSDAALAGDAEALAILKNVAQSDSAVALDSFAFALTGDTKIAVQSDSAVASDAFAVAGGTPAFTEFGPINIWNGAAWVRWNGGGWV